MAGRLASTISAGASTVSLRACERASAYAAGKDTAMVISAAHAADVVLVASSCQNSGSATPTSANRSSEGDPDHDGGWVALFGTRPSDASSVQPRGRRTTTTARASSSALLNPLHALS